MWKHKVDVRETVGMALCALLSLVAFLILLTYSDRLPVVVALAIGLACPLVWLAFLLWENRDGGGLVQSVRRRVTSFRPTPRRQDNRLTGVPAVGETVRTTAKARIT